MNPRIKALIIIGLLLATTLFSVADDMTPLEVHKVGKANLVGGVISELIFWIKRIAYTFRAVSYGTWGEEELKEKISEIIIMNPPVDELFSLMGAVMWMALAAYSLAITCLGFYLLFLSSSPQGRANAKSMLTKLVIGLVLVSLSPQLMEILLSISEEATTSILAFTGKGEFVKAMEDSMGSGGPLGGGMKSLHFWLTMIEVELGFYSFIFLMVLVWGSFIFPIIIRFFVVSIFIVLFPLAILLYSFEFSRALGRIMMEQTMIWIFLQVINALVLLAIVLSINSLGSKFIDIGWPIPLLIPAVGCVMFSIAPLFIIRFFRGFLP